MSMCSAFLRRRELAQTARRILGGMLIVLCAIAFEPCLPLRSPIRAESFVSVSLGLGAGYWGGRGYWSGHRYRHYHGPRYLPALSLGVSRVWSVPHYGPYYRPYYAPYYGDIYYDRYRYARPRDVPAEERGGESSGYRGPRYVPPRYIPPQYIPPRYIPNYVHVSE